MVPQKVFFTKGVGRHKDYLQSFELALRDAGIETQNLVTVSSIFPPGCKRISKEEGVKYMKGNAINLPFKDKTFGLVVSNLAIDFCPQEEAFREAHRVLSDGGKGIFYLHHPSMLRRFPKDEEIRIFWQYLKDNSVLFSSEEEIKTFLEKDGFAPLEISLKSEKENLFLNNREKETWWEVMVEKI